MFVVISHLCDFSKQHELCRQLTCSLRPALAMEEVDTEGAVATVAGAEERGEQPARGVRAMDLFCTR